MAKDQKQREPTWWERAAALTKAAAYTEHDGEPRTRAVPGKLARLNDRDLVLIVYDMRTRVWASDAEKALYEAAGSQAHGAARPARIGMSISMGVEYMVRDINAKGGTAYRLPPRSKLKWCRGTPPAPPKCGLPGVVAEAARGREPRHGLGRTSAGRGRRGRLDARHVARALTFPRL